MSRVRNGLLLLLACVVLTGCKREYPTTAGAVYQVPVENAGSLSVSGLAICSADGGQVKLDVTFRDRWNGLAKSPDLTYDPEGGVGRLVVPVGRDLARFTRVLAVPRYATSADVEFSSAGSGPPAVVSDFRVAARPPAVMAKRPWIRMSFVSLSFLAFVALVVLVHYLLPLFARPWFLLLCSVAFYGCFGWRALTCVAISATSVWLCGLVAGSSVRRVWALGATMLGLALNLGLLAALKYADAVLNPLLFHVGFLLDCQSWILPLGISFYTLQAVSYVVDVYKGTLKPERNPFYLFLYLLFFPTIMQGPISRYGQLGDQLRTPHRFDWDRLVRGSQLVLWGYFLKTVIADRLALAVAPVFAPGSSLVGLPVLLGSFGYLLQVYTDFAGCVAICRGVSEMLGIDLVENFRQPFFSSSVKEFWSRWHISFGQWLRDYVYIPLGGNRKGFVRKQVNILIVFALCGVWHGVGAVFLAWGLLQGLYQVIEGLLSVRGETRASAFVRVARTCRTFVLIAFAAVFIRVDTLSSAVSVFRRMAKVLSPAAWDVTPLGLDRPDTVVLCAALSILFVVSLIRERYGNLRPLIARRNFLLCWFLTCAAFVAVLVFGIYGPGYDASQFIYMQF